MLGVSAVLLTPAMEQLRLVADFGVAGGGFGSCSPSQRAASSSSSSPTERSRSVSFLTPQIVRSRLRPILASVALESFCARRAVRGPGRRRRARGLHGDRRCARASPARRAGDPRLPRSSARSSSKGCSQRCATRSAVCRRRRSAGRTRSSRTWTTRSPCSTRAGSNARGRSGTRGAATSRCTCSSRTRSDCSAS